MSRIRFLAAVAVLAVLLGLVVGPRSGVLAWWAEPPALRAWFDRATGSAAVLRYETSEAAGRTRLQYSVARTSLPPAELTALGMDVGIGMVDAAAWGRADARDLTWVTADTTWRTDLAWYPQIAVPVAREGSPVLCLGNHDVLGGLKVVAALVTSSGIAWDKRLRDVLREAGDDRRAGRVWVLGQWVSSDASAVFVDLADYGLFRLRLDDGAAESASAEEVASSMPKAFGGQLAWCLVRDRDFDTPPDEADLTVRGVEPIAAKLLVLGTAIRSAGDKPLDEDALRGIDAVTRELRRGAVSPAVAAAVAAFITVVKLPRTSVMALIQALDPDSARLVSTALLRAGRGGDALVRELANGAGGSAEFRAAVRESIAAVDRARR